MKCKSKKLVFVVDSNKHRLQFQNVIHVINAQGYCQNKS